MSSATIDQSNLLNGIFDPIARCMTPAVARKLTKVRAEPELRRRIAVLAAKCNEGDLTADERDEYDMYVSAIHFFTVLQSKARIYLKSHGKT